MKRWFKDKQEEHKPIIAQVPAIEGMTFQFSECADQVEIWPVKEFILGSTPKQFDYFISQVTDPKALEKIKIALLENELYEYAAKLDRYL